MFEAQGLTKQYPGTLALDSVDLEVRPGEVVALLGENGAGKSTLSALVAGSQKPTSGTMDWNGEPYAPEGPRDAIGAGILLIHQEPRLLPDLSVAENVVVGHWPTRRGGWIDHGEVVRRARQHLEELGFKGSPNQLVGELTVAGQQQVEIARALSHDSRMMILDEPTAAFGPDETDALFETVLKLKAKGYSFIYISHRLEEIPRIADRIVVLRDGRRVANHPSGAVDEDRLVREMVGRSIGELFPELPPAAREVVLEVDGLTDARGRYEDVSFQVHAGEVLGIAGIVGAGRTELVRGIAGCDPTASGSVRVRGRELTPNSVRRAIDAGIVLIPEDRNHQGLILQHTLEENIALANTDSLGPGRWAWPHEAARLAGRVCERLGVRGAPQDRAASLSGGNRQKVVIGKWLERDPTVVILDEPTRGIDVGARAEFYDVIVGLAAAGTSVVIVSSDLEEVLGLSHRVIVLARGRRQGILDRGEATQESVMRMAVR